MKRKQPESQLVRLLMPVATQAEIADATDRWFGLIEILDRMVARLEQEAPDSLPVQSPDSINNITTTT